MPRGKSAYNQFVARRLKGTPSNQLPNAMRVAAAEWRAMQHGGRGRSNPGGSGVGTLLVMGAVGYFGYKYLKSHGGLGAPAAPVVAR